MGNSNSTTNEILMKLNVTNEVINTIQTCLETNTEYVTKTINNVENCLNIINETDRNKTTEQTGVTKTEVNQFAEQINKLSINNTVVNDSLEVDQINDFSNEINSVQAMNMTLYSNDNIVVNTDAKIINDIVNENKSKLDINDSIAAATELMNNVESFNSATAELKQTDVDVNTTLGKLMDAIGGIGSSVNVTNKQNIDQTITNKIQNFLQTKNISNTKLATEIVTTSLFTFNHNNTVKNYMKTLQNYMSYLIVVGTIKQYNDIELNNVTLNAKTVLRQRNDIKTTLLNKAITTLSDESYFSNTSVASVSAATSVKTTLDAELTKSTSVTSDTKLSTSLKTTQESVSSLISTKASVNVMAIVIAVVVIVIGIGLLIGLPKLLKAKPHVMHGGNLQLLQPHSNYYNYNEELMEIL